VRFTTISQPGAIACIRHLRTVMNLRYRREQLRR